MNLWTNLTLLNLSLTALGLGLFSVVAVTDVWLELPFGLKSQKMIHDFCDNMAHVTRFFCVTPRDPQWHPNCNSLICILVVIILIALSFGFGWFWVTVRVFRNLCWRADKRISGFNPNILTICFFTSVKNVTWLTGKSGLGWWWLVKWPNLGKVAIQLKSISMSLWYIYCATIIKDLVIFVQYKNTLCDGTDLNLQPHKPF